MTILSTIKNEKDLSTKLDAKIQLYTPPLSELTLNLKYALMKNFLDVKVDVVDCPDLSIAPFSLASNSLRGSPKIVDVGGAGNVFPVIKNVTYDLQTIYTTIESPNCLALGSAAGPLPLVGFNTEFVCNARLRSKVSESIFNSYITYLKDPIIGSFKPYESRWLTDKTAAKFSFIANLFISDSAPGKVLKIHAKKRIGQENFVTCVQKGLAEKYGSNPVGLGGVFVAKNGRLNIQVMGMDLRLEHTHCFSNHGDGDHYCGDLSPDEIEYEGYFNVAENLYRIDRVSF